MADNSRLKSKLILPWLVAAAWLMFAGLVAVNYFNGIAQLAGGQDFALRAFLQDAAAHRSMLAFWFFCLVLMAGVFLLAGQATVRIQVSYRVVAVVIIVLVGLSYLLSSALPYGGEAWQRGAQAVFGAGVGFAYAWLSGTALARAFKWRWEGWLDGLLYPFALGAGVTGLTWLAVALVGGYTQAIIRIFTAGGVMILAAGLYLPGLLKDRASIRPAARLCLNLNLNRADRLWFSLILVTVLMALVGALAPEKEYDALWYHLWLPQQWMEAGRPVDIVTEFISLYPLTYELFLHAATVWGGVTAAKLLGYAIYLLAGAAIYSFARRLIPSAPAWLAVLLWLAAPTVFWEATTVYNDAALAFFVLLAVDAFFRFLQQNERQWYFVTAVMLGLALATKHLALLWLVLIAGGMFAALGWKKRSFTSALGHTAGLGVMAVALALPWYLRSAIASGNPFFPELYWLFGASPPIRWDAITDGSLAGYKAHFGFPRTFINLLLLPWHMLVHGYRFGGSLGPVFLLLIPMLVLKPQRTGRLWGVGMLAAGYVALWASPVSSYQMRFLTPVVPLLALLAAGGFGRFTGFLEDHTRRNLRKMVSGIVAALILFSLPPFTVLEEGREGSVGWMTHVVREVPVRVVTGLESQQQYLARVVDSYAAWDYIYHNLDASAKVLTFSGGDQLYSQRQRIPGDTVISRAAVWLPVPGQEQLARSELAKLGITHILFSQRDLAQGVLSGQAIGTQYFQQTCLSELYSDRHYRLYHLTCP